MYAYVRNILQIREDDQIPLFIRIQNQNDFYLFEFLQKLQILKGEDFFNIDNTLNLDDIINSNLQGINTAINLLINQYSFLGTFEFKAKIEDDALVVDISIVLNQEFNNTKYFNQELKIQHARKK